MKQFIVTDPCYIIPSDIWSAICTEVFSQRKYDSQKEMYRDFDKRVQEELRKFAKTELAWAGSTGIGDWSNSLKSNNREVANILFSQFGADSGMVCICELNSIIEKATDHLQYDWSVALFEVNDDDIVDGIIDQTDSNWTIVRVKVNGEEVITSEKSSMKDEETY